MGFNCKTSTVVAGQQLSRQWEFAYSEDLTMEFGDRVIPVSLGQRFLCQWETLSLWFTHILR